MDEQATDLNKITDVVFLKSMAYDALAARELAERNLQAINQRLAQVTSQPDVPRDTADDVNED